MRPQRHRYWYHFLYWKSIIVYIYVLLSVSNFVLNRRNWCCDMNIAIYVSLNVVELYIIIPEVVGGYIGFTPSVRHPPIRPSVRPAFGFLSVVQFWLDPFHIYTSYQATSEGLLRVHFFAKFKNLNFCQFLKICNFDFVFFYLGYDVNH